MEFIKSGLLENIPEIRYFITTRSGGTSIGEYSSLNLSMKVGDDVLSVSENRRRLAETLGLQEQQLFYPDQCHTDRVKEIAKTNLTVDLTSTDGLVTCDKGICLCVLAADCVPILLFDPVQHIVAALHAGWRGTYERIVSRAIEQMARTYTSKPEHILACIGPAISQKNYEVGDEVSAFFNILFSHHPAIIWKNPQTGRDHIDLQGANRILMHTAGLLDEHIEIIDLCTFSNPDILFSARRDGHQCGRFASGIFLI
jgi:polyphenol oxidase